MKLKLVMLLMFLWLVAGCGSNRSFPETEFPSREVKVGDTTYGYRLYLPPNRPPGEKLPVMLYLHGSNRRGSDNQQPLTDLAGMIKENPQNFPYIIVFAQCRPRAFWAGPMMEQAMAALDQTVTEFDGDRNRLSLAGFSMGGFGVWQFAVTHPDKFAALVSVAGGVDSLGWASDADRALLSPQAIAAATAEDPYRAYAAVLAETPAWIVHGAKDESVPVDASRKLAAALKAAGGTDVNYIELEGVGHGSLGQAFSDPRLGEWLRKQKKGEQR